MDTLNATVVSVEFQLENSKKTLRLIENSAKDSIGYKVKEMRGAIIRADKRIQHGVTEMQSFLTSIENNDAVSIDLSPQMEWLTKKLDAIVGDFQSAESSADSAREHARDSVLDILDASENVKRQEARLHLAKDLGQRLTDAAREELEASEEDAAKTRQSLAETMVELADNEKRATELRTEKAGLVASVNEVKANIQEAERLFAREKKKSKAFSLVSGAAAVGLAPLTGGFSLTLLGLSAGAAIGTAWGASEYKDKLREVQSQVREAEQKITEYEEVITSLKSTKILLEKTVEILESTVRTRQNIHDIYEGEVVKATSIQTDVELLENSAYSLKSNFQEAKSELDNSKEVLDAYTSKLHNFSAAIKAESSGPGAQRTGSSGQLYFRKRKRLMSNACEALQNMHVQVPMLLRGRETRFLTSNGWGSEEIWIGLEVPMPATCYRV